MSVSWLLGFPTLAVLCAAGIYFISASLGVELEDISHVTTIVGIIVGGGWVLYQFARTRELIPRANVHVRVSRWEQRMGHALVRVVLEIKNTGKVSLHVGEAKLWLQLMDPAPSDAIASVRRLQATVSDRAQTPSSVGGWPLLAERQIKYHRWQRVVEAGETDEIYFDFVVEHPARAIVVYAFVGKRHGRREFLLRRPLGWEIEKVYNVKEGGADEDHDEGGHREGEAPGHQASQQPEAAPDNEASNSPQCS